MDTFVKIENVKVEECDSDLESGGDLSTNYRLVPFRRRCVSSRSWNHHNDSWDELEAEFWDRYEKKKKIGEGTTATVYKCVEKATGRIVAVKTVRTSDEEFIFNVGF